VSELYDHALEWGVAIACCTEPDVVGPVLARVRPDDFHDAGAASVMRIVEKLHGDGEVVDKALVTRELRILGSEDVSLKLFDTTLELGVPQAAPGHARHVRALSLLRQLRHLGADLAGMASPDADPDAVIKDAIARLRVAGQELGSGEMTIADLVDETARAFDEDVAGDGLHTGIPRLDRVLDGGLIPTRLYVIGARPSVGKSALATNWIRLALDAGHRVLFVSLEMTGSEVLTRLVQEKFGIAGNRTEPEFVRRIMAAATSDELAAWRLHYLNATSIGNLIRRARELRADGMDLVVVDYVQLLPSERNYDNRAQEVAAFTRALKLMAMELRVPVVALSQLNRDSARTDRPPKLHDLRESGAIEQDANVVMLMHRDVDANAARADLLVAKNRHGATGRIGLIFQPHIVRFREALEAIG
jgi:replicative DNA helicase